MARIVFNPQKQPLPPKLQKRKKSNVIIGLAIGLGVSVVVNIVLFALLLH